MGNGGSMEIFEEGELENDIAKYSVPLDEKTSYRDIFITGYDTIVNTIIRPPRHQYHLSELGPDRFHISDLSNEFYREDFQLPSQGKTMECR